MMTGAISCFSYLSHGLVQKSSAPSRELYPLLQCGSINLRRKMRLLRIESWTADWELSILPLCYATPSLNKTRGREKKERRQCWLRKKPDMPIEKNWSRKYVSSSGSNLGIRLLWAPAKPRLPRREHFAVPPKNKHGRKVPTRRCLPRNWSHFSEFPDLWIAHSSGCPG